jgi:hypothetical protein
MNKLCDFIARLCLFVVFAAAAVGAGYVLAEAICWIAEAL